jgi:hypothetical protein
VALFRIQSESSDHPDVDKTSKANSDSIEKQTLSCHKPPSEQYGGSSDSGD